MELCCHQSVIELFGVPLPDDEPVGVDNEEVSHVIIWEEVGPQHYHSDLEVVILTSLTLDTLYLDGVDGGKDNFVC